MKYVETTGTSLNEITHWFERSNGTKIGMIERPDGSFGALEDADGSLTEDELIELDGAVLVQTLSTVENGAIPNLRALVGDDSGRAYVVVYLVGETLRKVGKAMVLDVHTVPTERLKPAHLGNLRVSPATVTRKIA